jgi:hypothetical protein
MGILLWPKAGAVIIKFESVQESRTYMCSSDKQQKLRGDLENRYAGWRVILILTPLSMPVLDDPAVVSRIEVIYLHKTALISDAHLSTIAVKLGKATRLTTLVIDPVVRTNDAVSRNGTLLASVILACKGSLRALGLTRLHVEGQGCRVLAEAVLQVKGLQSLKVNNPQPRGYCSDFWETFLSHASQLVYLNALEGACVRDVDFAALGELTNLGSLVAYRAPGPQLPDLHRCRTDFLQPDISRMSHLKRLELMGWNYHVTQLQGMLRSMKELQDLTVLPCSGGMLDWNTLLSAHSSLTRLDIRLTTFCRPIRLSQVRLNGFGRLRDLTISPRGAEHGQGAWFLPMLTQLSVLTYDSDDDEFLKRVLNDVHRKTQFYKKALHREGKVYESCDTCDFKAYFRFLFFEWYLARANQAKAS